MKIFHLHCKNTNEASKLWYSLMPGRKVKVSHENTIEKSAENDNSDLFKDLMR